MPIYTFICEKCQNKFDISCSIREYSEKQKCTACKSKKVYRSYKDDISSVFGSVKKHDSELKTVGDLAARNSDKFSDDHKEFLKQKHTAYKDQTDKPLPNGMSRISKGNKTKWT
jgi:putative FmdB family regulatory protein